MRHHDKTKKLGRQKDQRNALMRSLSCALVEKGRITTTKAKAKALRPYIEKIITKGKDDSLANRRVVLSRLGREDIVKKIFEEISPRYLERPGGYTRITKLPVRKSDASPMVIIEFV